MILFIYLSIYTITATIIFMMQMSNATYEELHNNIRSFTIFEINENKKTEGVLRNFLFLNPLARKYVRFIKFIVSDISTVADEFLFMFSDKSNIFVVSTKPL